MIIGVPKEIKNKEFRVGITPAGVKSLTNQGHALLIETGAGLGSGIEDAAFSHAGGNVLPSAAEVYSRADMIIKVKEPQEEEYSFLREGQVLFTYLHLAPLRELTEVLLEKKIIGVAFETVKLDNGSLPLLAPMSCVAGRMAVQVGAHFLEKEQGGRGVLLGGVPGVLPGNVVVLGSGTVGSHAAAMAVGLQARVTVMGRNMVQLNNLDSLFQGKIHTLAISSHAIEEALIQADLIIGAVLVPGANAPKLIRRAILPRMRPGSVIVDVAIDQGGCAETSSPTTHSNPIFTVEGVIHYCVANMPGAVPHTSTFALCNATLPYASQIASLGIEIAAQKDPAIARGINVYKGKLTNKEVAESQGRKWQPYDL